MSDGANNDVPGGEPAPEVVTSTATLGARLAIARQSKEWTVEHVASQLNLAARQIHALETDNYGALPGMASVRGFVRAYAKLLKIDATPLVAMIASEQITPTQPLEPKRNLAAAPFSDNRLMSSSHRRSSPKTILVAIVLVLLALAAVVIERIGGWPALSQSLSAQFKQISESSAISPGAPPSGAAEAANVDAAAPAAEVAATPVVTGSSAAPSAARDEPVVNEAVKAVSSTPPQAERKTEVPVATTAGAESKSDKAVAGAKNLLVLKVRQDSWVEIKQGHNTIISRLMRAGSTEQVEITEPAALTLGNAAGVDVIFRGSPLDTKADAKNNVVRLSLR